MQPFKTDAVEGEKDVGRWVRGHNWATAVVTLMREALTKRIPENRVMVQRCSGLASKHCIRK